MQERHSNRKQYFKEQGVTTEEFVIPYIDPFLKIEAGTRVLEIGCGEGGNLPPFINRDCKVVGIDLNEQQIENARAYIEEFCPGKPFTLLNQNIYDADLDALGQFDLIMMRDVIEHIHDQERFMSFIKILLKPEGKIFFGFPPWRMPFGGHQQICDHSLLSKLPFYHLLPMSVYRGLLKASGESPEKIADLIEIKETGISIRRFEKIVKKEGYSFDTKTLFFINPNYQTKFGLKPRKLNMVISKIPYFRDFFTTCYYCLIKK